MKAMFPAFALTSLTALLTISSGVVAQPSCSLGSQDHVENPLGFLNHGVANTEIAVGTERNLTCSNVFLRLLDKNGNVVQFSNPTRDAETPLGNYNDSNYPDFMFPVAGCPQTGDIVIIGDPMVYFDQDDERFWVVAVEVHFRSINMVLHRVHSSVHIAVSTNATPTIWDALTQGNPDGAWRKYHHCL